MPDQLTIDETTHGDHTVLDVVGEIDLATAPMFESAILAADLGRSVLIDLSGVSFIDSTGLRVLITAHERAQDEGGKLSIVAADGPVTKLFAITGVDDWLNVYSTRTSATSNG